MNYTERFINDFAKALMRRAIKATHINEATWFLGEIKKLDLILGQLKKESKTILARLTSAEKRIIKNILAGNEDYDLMLNHPNLYEKLYDYYVFETAEMPYGTAKARTGDPDVWILDKLDYELYGGAYGLNRPYN